MGKDSNPLFVFFCILSAPSAYECGLRERRVCLPRQYISPF